MVAYNEPTSDFGFVQDGDLGIISTPCDFLGVNYYEKHIVRADPADPEHGEIILPAPEPLTAVGNGFNPDGLRDLLVRVSREYTSLPLYVTESGTAFHDYVTPEGRVPDDERVVYLHQQIQAIHEAITQGVDLRGYFVWSFLDNFEWTYGYSQRYGLMHVEFGTQQRTPKRSAHWYRQVIQRNGLE